MTSNVFQCGNAWQALGDPQAGWELLQHLRSPEIEIRNVAEEFLVEAGPRSIKLLQAAFVTGVLEPEIAVQSLVTVVTAIWWDEDAGNPNLDPFQYDC